MNGFKRQKSLVTPGSVLNGITYINITLFIISLIFTGKGIGLTLNPFYTLTPSARVLGFMGASGTIPIDAYGAWWSLITANWLHGSLLHIVFNLLALRTIAPLILHEFGPYRMFSIYTLTGAAGFLMSYLGNVELTIGASSGLCCLIGASLYFGKSRGGSYGRLVYKQTSGWVVTLVLIGFLVPNINNWGHAGGLLSGILAGLIFGYNSRRPENMFDKLISTAFMLITLVFLTWSVIQGFVLIYL